MNRISRTDPCFNAFIESAGDMRTCKEPAKEAPTPRTEPAPRPVKFNSPDEYIQPNMSGPFFMRFGPTCFKK